MHIGEGELLRRRQAIVERLQREGLVDRPRRPLPRFPRKVGLVCGDPSDAFHDVLGGLRERFPAAGVVFCPSIVQGMDAPAALIRAIVTLNDVPEVDVIVVARGGGSVADLAAFDDEELCRIAARNPVPIVAAVGHTANRPVIYQVAELTASVPREVGLIVVPDRRELPVRWIAPPATACAISGPCRTGDERLAALSRRRALLSACLDPRSHALAGGGRRLDDFTRDFHARRLEQIAAATERRRAAVRRVPGADRLDAANARLAGAMRRAMDTVTVNAAQRLAATLARIRAHDPSAQGFAVVQAGAQCHAPRA